MPSLLHFHKAYSIILINCDKRFFAQFGYTVHFDSYSFAGDVPCDDGIEVWVIGQQSHSGVVMSPGEAASTRETVLMFISPDSA
jgi:hypothetical protein